MMARRTKGEKNEQTQLPIRMTMELRNAIEQDAAKSGWSAAEQIRYELMVIRGMWKTPYLPSQDAPRKT